MVRTFLCHPFSDQQNFTDQYDPSCFCCTSDNSFIVGSLFGSINILKQNESNITTVHKFASAGIPVKLIYSDDKHFLISLESQLQDYKSGFTTKEMNCRVRIYYNIMLGSVTQTMHPLNCGYSLNNNDILSVNWKKETFTVLELNGIRQNLTDVTLCNIHNNIAVCNSSKIYIYAYKEFWNQDPSIKYIDFIRMIEIETTLNLRGIALTSNWLVFSSKMEIRAVCVHLHQPLDQKVYQGEEATELLDQDDGIQSDCKNGMQQQYHEQKIVNTFLWNFVSEGCDGFEKQNDNNVIKLQSIQEEKPYVDTMKSSKEVLGEHSELVGHPLCCTFVGQISPGIIYASVSCTTHFYRRFNDHEVSFSGKADKIHSLQWLPIFLEGCYESNAKDDVLPWKMFASKYKLLTMPLFFSTGSCGYLYDVSQCCKLITSYNYISDCHWTQHTSSMVYALSRDGLEVYTSRLFSFASELAQSQNKSQKILGFKSNLHLNEHSAPSESSIDCKSTRRRSHIYSLQQLLLPCPHKGLETCLIGMYPYQNVSSFGVNDSIIVLFLKTDRKRDRTSSMHVYPWSLHSVRKPSTIEVSIGITELIKGNEFSNPTVYHQMLSESYLLTMSNNTMGLSDNEETLALLQSLATQLSYFLIRCDSSFDVSNIEDYFLFSGLQHRHVLMTLKTGNEGSEKKNCTFGPGMITYLNSKLFDSGEPVDFGKDLNEYLLNVYGKNDPSLLTQVILNSRLKNNYSLDLCVKLMSKYKRKKEGKSGDKNPLDQLCFAFLHMQLGNPGHAEELLKELPEKSLREVCFDNISLLLNASGKLTGVGQLLKKHFKRTFHSVLIDLFNDGKIDIIGIVSFFKQSKENDFPCSYQACEVIEQILNDISFRKRFNEVLFLLVDQYILRLGKGVRSDGWKVDHNHELKGNGHFSARYSWLNSIHPFSGDLPTPNDCILTKENQRSYIKNSAQSLPSDDSLIGENSHHDRGLSYNIDNRTSSILQSREYCPCCCCSEVLLKFQCLLCWRNCSEEMCKTILTKLENCSFVGKDSLLLLCWPRTGHTQKAIDYMVKNYPRFALQYAKEMFEWKTQLVTAFETFSNIEGHAGIIKNWQLLLEHMFELVKVNSEHWNQDSYSDILKGVLLRLTRAFPAKEFLGLLPDNASVNLMLPYIVECCEFSKSSEIRTEILQNFEFCD